MICVFGISFFGSLPRPYIHDFFLWDSPFAKYFLRIISVYPREKTALPVTASALDPDQPTSKLTYVVHRDAPAPAPYHLGATVHL